MIIALYSLIAALSATGAVLLYLGLIRPDSRRRQECLAFSAWNFAHRGLWDMNAGIPENSLPAFRRAAERGFAIELDVHLTADGQLAVFHDDTLSRMCGLNRTVESMNYSELARLRLLNTEHRIPLLSEVLKLVEGRVPLLIEMKLPTRSTRLCPLLDRELAAYSGPYLIESFNPLGLRWYRKHRPAVLRGQLACRHAPAPGLEGFLRKLSASLLINCVSRPHFIAYHFLHMDGLGVRLNQSLFQIPVFAWTIRSQEDFEECKEKYCGVIFEGFVPRIPV